MAGEPLRILVLDTSVLVNFLAVDRMDLLARYPARCLITDHVRGEILEHYSERFQRFQAALALQILSEQRVDRPDELVCFAALSKVNRLGLGECSAIALATQRRYELAIDDRRARNEALSRYPDLVVHRTEDIIISLLRANALPLEEADTLKETWANEHSFRLKISSFQELL